MHGFITTLKSLCRNQLTDIFYSLLRELNYCPAETCSGGLVNSQVYPRQRARGATCKLLTTRAKKFDYQEY